MKWSRAVHHLEQLAEACAAVAAGPPALRPLRVTALWAYGEVLGPPRDLEVVEVALAVDLPEAEVPWRSEPPGAQQFAHATRLVKVPVAAVWRSAQAQVWSALVVRPVLVWDERDGTREPVLAALRDGRGEEVRAPAPEPDALRDRMRREAAVSLAGLRAATAEYDERRWRPGKLEPVADRLWRAADGWLEVRDAAASLDV